MGLAFRRAPPKWSTPSAEPRECPKIATLFRPALLHTPSTKTQVRAVSRAIEWYTASRSAFSRGSFSR